MEKRNAHSTLKFNKNKVGLKRRFFDKSISLPILSLFFFFLFTSLISAQSIGITDCTDLQNIDNNLSLDYHLTQNIDCSGVTFNPIGLNVGKYAGTFEGNDYAIFNLDIYCVSVSGCNRIGLFSELNNSGIIKNVGLINADVTGNDYVGGLVGNNFGVIENSFVNVNVSGNNYVGGLIGNSDYGVIENSYATGTVTGDYYVGGLVGNTYYGTIINSYATGTVTGNFNTGGLVGNNLWGTITNSYYDTNTSGQSDTGKGIPKTTTQMQNINTFVNWDIVLIENFNETSIWYIDNGNDYPRLRDTEPPTFQLVMNGLYTAGINTSFALDVDDDLALHPSGTYIFSTNISGSWVNETIQNFTTTPQTITSKNYTLPLNVNETFGYRWYIIDNAGTSNHTQIFTAIITPQCYVNEDCDKGNECLNNICVLIPKDYTTIFINIALMFIIVTFLFGFLSENKLIKKGKLK